MRESAVRRTRCWPPAVIAGVLPENVAENQRRIRRARKVRHSKAIDNASVGVPRRACSCTVLVSCTIWLTGCNVNVGAPLPMTVTPNGNCPPPVAIAAILLVMLNNARLDEFGTSSFPSERSSRSRSAPVAIATMLNAESCRSAPVAECRR